MIKIERGEYSIWILFFLSGVQLLYNVVLALLCIKQITHVCAYAPSLSPSALALHPSRSLQVLH